MNVRSMLSVTLSMAMLAFAAGHATAQVRDVQRPAVGTASISGVVVSDSPTPRPIRRVTVTLTETAGTRLPAAAITDDAGVFSFRDLPPGTYTLVASRAAFVTSAYGARTYGRGSGIPISLLQGQTIKDITLKMIRGAVIAGTLRDPSGRPAANAELILLVSRTDAGRRRLAPAITQSGRTNSRGEYRIFGLTPGDYVVRAQPQMRFGQGDLRPTTAAEVEWAKRAAAGSADAPPPTGRPVTYAASYYPGTSDVSDASLITVGPGEERQGIDFSIQLIPTATISGRISGPDGQPPKNPAAALQLQSANAASFIDAMIGIASTGGFGGGVRVGADGKFSVSGVAPGRYRMTFHGAPSTAAGRPGVDAGGLGVISAMMPGLAGAMGATLWATEDVSVSGQDLADLDIRLQPGLTMSGTIVFEGEDPQSPPDASRTSISLNSADKEATSAFEMVFSLIAGSTPGRATKERTFAVDGLAPARYRFVASPPGVMNPFGTTVAVAPDGWALKSAMWNGRDLADGTFEVRSDESLTGVVVTFTKAVTEISGRLLDAAGRPTAGFPIVVFSTKPSDWTGGSRRVISAKPASDGTYRIRGLPAGEYYLCTLLDLDLNDLYDAAFLDQLKDSSFKLTLIDGEKKTQDLKIRGGS